MRLFLFSIVLLLSAANLQAQTIPSSPDTAKYVYWSPVRKLQVNDFKLKADTTYRGSTFFQIYYAYDFKAANLKSPDFKVQVKTFFDRNASWLDTTFTPPSVILRYVQTAFDISEVHSRKFKQRLQENRTELEKNPNLVAEIEKQIDQEKKQLQAMYDSQTKFGTVKSEQVRWESKIAVLLQNLQAFASDSGSEIQITPKK